MLCLGTVLMSTKCFSEWLQITKHCLKADLSGEKAGKNLPQLLALLLQGTVLPLTLRAEFVTETQNPEEKEERGGSSCKTTKKTHIQSKT